MTWPLVRRHDHGGCGKEFIRTTEIVARRLPPPPAVIADIGGGPCRYALGLASLGYQVEHRDLMPARPVHEGADRGLPGLHVRVVAVPQNIYLCEGSVGEGRSELRNNGISRRPCPRGPPRVQVDPCGK